MNSTTTLRACNTNWDLLPRSRRVLSRRRVGFSTVVLEHTCGEQQQQVSSISECIDVESEQQHMRQAVEAVWKIPSAVGSSWSDLQALSSAPTMFHGREPGLMRTRRAHQLSETASSSVDESSSSADSSMHVSGTRSVSISNAPRLTGTARMSSRTSRSMHRTSSSRSARLTDAQEPDDEAIEINSAIAVPLLGTTRASALNTLLRLWHLHTGHNAPKNMQDAQRLAGTKSTVFSNESARLLTAAEEATLGSIVQQHRKLLQLYQMQPNLQRTMHEAPGVRMWQSCLLASHAAADNSSPAAIISSSSSSVSPAGSSTSMSKRRLNGCLPADAAAAAAEATSSHDSSSDSMSSSDDVVTPSSSNSSRNSRKCRQKGKSGLHGEAVHGNMQWPPPLTEADLQEVADMPRMWRALLVELGPMAQQLLVGFNTGLVAHMLQYCRRSSIPTEDLLASGLVGLKLAATRYNPSRNTRFSTVASSWILQHMQRAADMQRGTFRTPVRYSEMLRAVLHGYGADALKGIENKPAVLQQVADHFKTKPLTVLRALRAVSSAAFAASLDMPSYSGPGSSRAEEDSTVPMAAMLTSTDLDDDSDDGSSDGSSTGLAGAGSYMAAAGQLPSWIQHQHMQVVVPANSAADVDAEAATKQHVETLLQVLQPRERMVMLMLYGDDAHDLARMAWDLQEARRAGRRRKHSAPAARDGTASRRKYESKNSVSLSTVAQLLGMTAEAVRLVRDTAVKKLRLAAEAMGSSSSSSSGGLDVGDMWRGETAGNALSAASAAASSVGSAGDAVAAAIQACPARQRRFLWALQDYYAMHRVMPGHGVDHKGCHLGQWCSKLYFKFTRDQGSLSPQLLHALELVAPGWVEGMAQRQYGNRHARLKHLTGLDVSGR